MRACVRVCVWGGGGGGAYHNVCGCIIMRVCVL